MSGLMIRYFRGLLKRVCMRMKKVELVDNFMVIYEFLKSCFDLQGNYFRLHGKDLPFIEKIEEAQVEAFCELAVKLNEQQLGQIVVNLVKWAKSLKKLKNHQHEESDKEILGFNLHR